MRLVRLVVALLLACAVVPVATADAQRRPRPAQVERARQLFTEGQAAYEAGDLRTALSKMLEAYRLTRSAELAFNVARIYERMSDADNAIEYFNIYLSRGQPTDLERIDIAARIAQLDEMRRRQREQVLLERPTNEQMTGEARRLFDLGVRFFERRRYTTALTAFTDALRYAPLPEIYYNMALTAERMPRLQDAIDYYREYLRMRRDAPDRTEVEARIRELRARQLGE